MNAETTYHHYNMYCGLKREEEKISELLLKVVHIKHTVGCPLAYVLCRINGYGNYI